MANTSHNSPKMVSRFMGACLFWNDATVAFAIFAFSLLGGEKRRALQG